MRGRVALAVCRLIAEEGFDSVTVREVARSLACSTAVVQHYFRNKREMILYVHTWTQARAIQRVSEALETHPDSILEALVALLPIDAEQRQHWQVWIAFWGRAIGDPELGAAQGQSMAAARERFRERLSAMRKDGHVNLILDDGEVARLLLQRVHAIAVEAVFDIAEYPAERQWQIIGFECEQLLRPAPSVAPRKKKAASTKA